MPVIKVLIFNSNGLIRYFLNTPLKRSLNVTIFQICKFYKEDGMVWPSIFIYVIQEFLCTIFIFSVIKERSSTLFRCSIQPLTITYSPTGSMRKYRP